MKCKVITSPKNTLEEDINKWLKTEKVDLTSVTQTENEVGYVTVTIFYLDIKETRKKKLDKLNNL
jgi:hypothetical protein